MTNLAQFKLGKKPFAADSRDLRLASYVDRSKILDGPAIPAAYDWTKWRGADGRVPPYDADPLGNDVLGDCTFAGFAHKLRRIGQLTGNLALASISAEQVKGTYLGATGGNDWGYGIRDMLKMAQKDGLFGVRIDAFAAVNWRDPDERRVAGWLGCGTINGYALPLASQTQVDGEGRQLWHRPEGGWPAGQGPGTWGLHCEDNHAEGGDLGQDNSWGLRTTRTEEWIQDCCDECWLVLVPEWAAAGRSLNGFAYQDLLADARARS